MSPLHGAEHDLHSAHKGSFMERRTGASNNVRPLQAETPGEAVIPQHIRNGESTGRCGSVAALLISSLVAEGLKYLAAKPGRIIGIITALENTGRINLITVSTKNPINLSKIIWSWMRTSYVRGTTMFAQWPMSSFSDLPLYSAPVLTAGSFFITTNLSINGSRLHLSPLFHPLLLIRPCPSNPNA